MMRVLSGVAALGLLIANASGPLLAEAPHDVAGVVDAIPEAAFAAPILMVGESHRRPTSHAFTLGLIRRALANDHCVTFALEIPVNQTATWRALAEESSAVESMNISSIHDSPSLRRLLRQTAELARHTCLELSAVDWIPFQSIDHVGGRDYLLAEHIAARIQANRLVIALLGSGHAPRHIDWDFDKPGQSTSYYLIERGIEPYVILQDWVEVTEPRVLHGNADPTVNAYNASQSHRSVVPANSFTRYADRLIQWPDAGTSEFRSAE